MERVCKFLCCKVPLPGFSYKVCQCESGWRVDILIGTQIWHTYLYTRLDFTGLRNTHSLLAIFTANHWQDNSIVQLKHRVCKYHCQNDKEVVNSHSKHITFKVYWLSSSPSLNLENSLSLLKDFCTKRIGWKVSKICTNDGVECCEHMSSM